MNKLEYTPDFEAVWDAYKIACHPASFGSKYEALLVWQKLRPVPTVDELIEAIRIQKSNDRINKKNNIFVPVWKHFCRWLKYRCWEGLEEIKDVKPEKKYYQPKPMIEPIATGNIAEQFNQLIKKRIKS